MSTQGRLVNLTCAPLQGGARILPRVMLNNTLFLGVVKGGHIHRIGDKYVRNYVQKMMIVCVLNVDD